MNVRVRTIDVFARERGQGAPVLFLHGVPDTSDIWGAIMTQLQSDFRCIAPDWPGFGRSGPGDTLDCSLDGHADFTRDLADALNLVDPFYLVGHDFGGVIAMAFLSKYPQRVRRCVISNAAFSSDYRWHTWARIWRTRGLGELSLALMNRWVFSMSLRTGSRKLSDAHIQAAYRHVSPMMKRTILRMYRAMPEQAWEAWNPRLQAATARVPTLVLWGQHDPYLPNWLPERFGPVEVRRYHDSGQWVPAEEADAMSEEIRTFFGTNTPAA